MPDAKNKKGHPLFTPEVGQDQQGITRWFILAERNRIPKAVFISFEGSLVRFDTLADAQLFCKMANASFISFPYTTK